MQIKAHILKHGDIRKKTKVNVGNEVVEVETFMEEEDEETYTKDPTQYADRRSFSKIRE